MLELERFARVNLLYDFYGPLLTERQRRIMELHYQHDFSLGEIAAECGVTRQAVHDILRRAEAALEGYEEKLGLVRRFTTLREKIEGAARLIDGLPGACEAAAELKRIGKLLGGEE
ncbi:MAG: YlxM family DNA-binding protein [Bacillota bacterium]